MKKEGFAGGALSFKGDKKAKKKKTKSKHNIIEGNKSEASANHKTGELAAANSKPLEPQDELTEAERKALIRKKERERKDLEKMASKSHRENIEAFNEKLGKLTEHNDIPRVSAAGNG